MDIAFKNICELISSSGPIGISWNNFKSEIQRLLNLKESQLIWPPKDPLTFILKLYFELSPHYTIGTLQNDQFKKDPKTKLMFYNDLRPVDFDDVFSLSDPSSLRFYCSNPSVRYSHLFQGRPIQLGESSLLVLEVIASYGRNGLTQAELAKVLGCESKNAFHWLKSLIANDLIARTPVASKKSFTYLLTLTKYLDEEFSHQSDNFLPQTHNVVSSKEIRQRIIDILAKAPNQTMVSKDVFEQTGLDKILIKNFRRAVNKLNEIGWLEYLFEDQLIGPYGRLFRLKRKPAEGLDLNAFLALQDEAKRTDNCDFPTTKLPAGSDYRPDQPIIHQIILLLVKSFPESLATLDLSHRLNISRKYLYRLIDRIIPPSSRKAGVTGAEGVGKVSEFFGKEKRIKFFIKSEEWKDYYLKLFSENVSNLEIPGSLLSSRPTTPSSITSATSTSIPQSSSDTRTRQLRHQALLQELSQRQILEVSKDLCSRIQNVLGDTRFTLDLKTLRRSIEILEREGKLKVVVASLPTSTRSLLILPELSASDEVVQKFILKISENVRAVPLSATTVKLEKLKDAMQEPDYFIEGSLPFGLPQNPSANIRALQEFGFISGILARAQLFHEFLLNNSKESFSFETIPIIFEKLPFGLYLKLIGIVRIGRELYENISALNSTCLIDLPEPFRDELSFNRKRFQAQVLTLLGVLEDLKLIQSEEHFASLNFKLPLKYNFAKEVPLYNYKGNVLKIIKFSKDSGFKEFWDGMQQIYHDYYMKTASIHSDDDERDGEISKIILLARHADSWREKPSRERDLERIVKTLALEIFNSIKTNRHKEQNHKDEEVVSLKVQDICNEFQVSMDRVYKMIKNYSKILEDRLSSKRRRVVLETYNHDHEDEDDNESEIEGSDDNETDRWTKYDWSKLSLAFCILQQSHFSSSSSSNLSGIKWILASKVFDKPKSPIIIRRHGLKLFKSYKELAEMVQMDSLVKLIMKSINLNCNDTITSPSTSNLENEFLKVFQVCQSQLAILNDDDDEMKTKSIRIMDQFNINNHDQFEVLSPRLDHYLNTIDSWVQTRSFRHGLLQNQKGLTSNPSHKHNCLMDETCLLLRQILVYSMFASVNNDFDYDFISNIIKSINPTDLSKSIDQLVSTGFAARNKTRDRTRLFNFPLVVSDPVRQVLEEEELGTRGVVDGIIDNTTESMNFRRIEGMVESFMEGNVDIVIRSFEDVGSIKFVYNLDYSTNKKFTIDTNEYGFDPRSLWMIPKSISSLSIDSFGKRIVLSCANHVKKSIKSRPGITVIKLKGLYEKVFEGFEVDWLIKFLVGCGEVELLFDEFLQ